MEGLVSEVRFYGHGQLSLHLFRVDRSRCLDPGGLVPMPHCALVSAPSSKWHSPCWLAVASFFVSHTVKAHQGIVLRTILFRPPGLVLLTGSLFK